MKNKKIDGANDMLLKNIQSIRTVTEWALLMGYKDSSHFSRKYRNQHNLIAVKSLTRMRLKLIEELIKQNREILNYELARKVGLRDEQDLYNFVHYHLGCSPTELKRLLSS